MHLRMFLLLTLGVLPLLDFLLIACHYLLHSFVQMFVKVQSSWFQVVFLHHTVAEDALPQSDLLLFFFILSFFELFCSFEALLLVHHFVVLQLHVCWVILQLCSILLSFSNITSWTLLFNFFGSSKRSSNV